jgi:competence protein ComEC
LIWGAAGSRGFLVVTIIYWACGWLFGILIASVLELPTPLWIGLGTLGLLTIALLHQHAVPLAIAIALSAIALGAARYNLSRPAIDPNHIAFYLGLEKTILSGVVVKAPDIHETYQSLIVATESIHLPGEAPKPVSGRILIHVPRIPIIEYGTRIEAKGTLEEADNFGTFDYRAYLANHGILAVMNEPWLTLLETRAGNPLMHLLLSIRQRAQESINILLPQPQAALLSGILLGDDHAIPEELAQDFRDTGTTHIIAISGFNIAIILGALLAGGRQLVGIRIAAWIAIVGVILYTLLVGAEASVVRAGIMAILMILAATMLGRPTFLPAVLVSAAFLMSLINPTILWDIGFQLSFAATLGLSFYLGPWSHRYRDLLQPIAGTSFAKKSAGFVSDVILATFAATIMTLPLMIYHFKTISLVSPFANLLILPAQPGIMTWGGMAAMIGMVSPALGQIPAWFAWLFLSYTIVLVQFFASLPYASLALNMPLLGLFGGYAIIIAATAIGRNSTDKGDDEVNKKWRLSSRSLKILLFCLLMLIILSAVWLGQRPDGKLHVSFLDVEQGDAILIESPDGRQMLVDGGQYPGLLLSRVGEQLPFWDKQLDLVVATHPDSDHVAGLVDLFANYQVGRVITNGSHEQSGTGYFGLLSTADRANIFVRGIRTGEVIKFGADVEIEILHAGDLPGSDQDNDESIVMRLVYDNFSLLLTGDAGMAAEKMLLRKGVNMQSTVLKAGHHGSNTATSREFLQAVHPQIVIISGGGERYGHPHEEVLQRIAETGATVWRTDESGTIELISDGKMMWSNMTSKSVGHP